MADPAVVAALLLARCDALDDILPVAMPDVTFTPPADGKYLEVSLFSNSPFWEGLTEGRVDQGLLQISVVWPRHKGLVAHREVAAQVMAHFPKGLRLESGGVAVKINKEPWAAAPLIEDAKTVTPITVSWIAG